MKEISRKSAAYHIKKSNRLAAIFQSPLFIATVIAVVTFIVFIHVLWADFVMWDDDRMVYQNPNLTGLSLKNLGQIFTHTDVTRRYTPLAALNYSITYQLYRLNPFGYHLSPWLFHGLNAALVFFVLRILLITGFRRQGNKKLWNVDVCAAIGALAWSLHPLRTETVAWVGANFYGQAMFFLLLSLLCYLWANKADIRSPSHLRRVLASAGLFAAALLSHPIVIGFFVVFIVLDVYPFGKLRGRWPKSAEEYRTLLEKAPFVAVGVIIIIVTVIIRLNEGGEFEAAPLSQFGIFERFMQAMYILAYYIWRPWYPFRMAPVYTSLVSFNPLSLPFLASAMIVIAVTFALWRLRRRWPLGLALGVCYLALSAPVLGLFEHPHYPSDRYSLIISLVWSVLIGVWLAGPKIRRGYRTVVLIISIVIITAWGVLTFRQIRIWDNSVTLFKHVIQNLGDDPYRQDIYGRLGDFYMQQGDTTKAAEQFQQALKINPLHSSLMSLSIILTKQGKIDDAVEYLREALKTDPNSVPVINNLAWLLAVYKDAKCHNPEMAIQLGKQACKLTDYQTPQSLNTLAAAFAAAGRFPDAVAAAENALKLAQLSEQQKQIKESQYYLQLYKSGRPYIIPLSKVPSD